MARYKVQGPDGRTYIVEGPDGASQEEVLAAAQQLASQDVQPQAKPLTNSNASRIGAFRQNGDPDIARWSNPTGSGWENFAAGMGKSLYDTGRGIGQLFGAVSEQDVEESRRRDEPLTRTTGGQLGQITGTVAQIAGPGAVAKAAGAPAMVTNALMPTSLMGNVAQGAVLGAIQPVGRGESRLQNAAIGGGAGAVGYAIPGIVRGAKAAFVDPLTDAGNDRILARTLQQSAQDPSRLLNPQTSAVPGYQPTLAEATLDPGIAQLQRAFFNTSQDVANAVDTQQAANNLARVRALETVAPDSATAIAQRSAATKPLYEAARQGTAAVDDEFKALMSRPSIKEGLRQARSLAAEEGVKLPKKVTEYSGAHLQYVDQALSKQIEQATASGAKGYAKKLIATQQELRGWMERQIPEYMDAQQQFRALSQPVNQADIAEEIRRRAFSNSSDLRTGAPIIRPDSAKGAIKDLEATARRAGVRGDPRQILTKQQQDTLNAVSESLDRYTNAQQMGMARGQSATAQNVAGMNALSQAGLPSGLLNFGPVGRLAGVLDTAFKVAGVPERLQARMAQIVTNPQEAQRLIMALPENDRNIAVRALNFITSQQSGARLAIAGSQTGD